MDISCNLHALQVRLPKTVLDNETLCKQLGTDSEWIVTRTGIHQRHKLEAGENASDLAVESAKETLALAGIEAKEVTHVIVATCTPDKLSPSTACIIAGKIGLIGAMAFDVNAACTGFIYCLSLCKSILVADPNAKILLVCSEAVTRRVDWTDRSTCVLFGDATASCLISNDQNKSFASLEDSICESDGTLANLITVGGGTACEYAKNDPINDDFFIKMQGKEVYRHAVRQMTSVCNNILARNNLNVSDIALVIPHQANQRIIESVGQRLQVAPDRIFCNVGAYGNTSSASIPLAIFDAFSQNKLKAGDKVLLCAFGSGLTWGAGLLTIC